MTVARPSRMDWYFLGKQKGWNMLKPRYSTTGTFLDFSLDVFLDVCDDLWFSENGPQNLTNFMNHNHIVHEKSHVGTSLGRLQDFSHTIIVSAISSQLVLQQFLVEVLGSLAVRGWCGCESRRLLFEVISRPGWTGWRHLEALSAPKHRQILAIQIG